VDPVESARRVIEMERLKKEAAARGTGGVPDQKAFMMPPGTVIMLPNGTKMTTPTPDAPGSPAASRDVNVAAPGAPGAVPAEQKPEPIDPSKASVVGVDPFMTAGGGHKPDPQRVSVTKDVFMTHGRLMPEGQARPRENIQGDAFLTGRMKDPNTGLARFEGPEKQYNLGADPFLTHTNRGKAAASEYDKKVTSTSADPFLTHTPAVEKAKRQHQLGTGRSPAMIKMEEDEPLMDMNEIKALAALVAIPGAQILPIKADKGTKVLNGIESRGFGIGQTIRINPGGWTEEWNVIEGFGSLYLKYPLKYLHLPGEVVVGADEKANRPGGPGPAEPAAPPPEDDNKLETAPVLEGWYRAENNFLECRQVMMLEFRRQYEDTIEMAMDLEERGEDEEEEGHGKKEDVSALITEAVDRLFDATGGRMSHSHIEHMNHHRKDFFTDKQFPKEDVSWFKTGEAEKSTLPKPYRWKRVADFCMGPPYKPPMMDSNTPPGTEWAGRVYQGCPHNFYLIQALQALSMKPQLIANVFCNLEFCNNRMGLYMLRFYKHGQWQYVDIDDYLPLQRNYTPMCCQTEFYPDFMWAPLIEKAYAKLHGSWEGLSGGGHVEEVLTDLTGGCATRYGTIDVANDRLWMYLYEMQRSCVFAVNINAGSCKKRNIPVEAHWACAIWKVAKHEEVPYICVCSAAPALTLIHMPHCKVPSPDNRSVNEGFIWLRIDDFCQLFDTIYECRLVNSDLGPPALSGVPHSPGYIPDMPWLEQLWAYQGDVHSDNAPCFLMDVPHVPNEIILEVSQTDLRFQESDSHDDVGLGRSVQAPLLLRFFQCSKEVTDLTGGEIYLVHLSAWGHTRDSSTAVKVTAPGRYMAMVSMPPSFMSNRLIFRAYSTLPVMITPVLNHRSFVCVNPTQPLNAMPYSLAGFMRIDNPKQRVPQNFDESEGRGKPLANPTSERRELSFWLRSGGTKTKGQWGHLANHVDHGDEGSGSEEEYDSEEDEEQMVMAMNGIYPGMKMTGHFGGVDAEATLDAKEGEVCSVM